MKYAIPLLTLFLGFLGGWHLSNQRMEEKVKEAFPEEMQAMLEEVNALIGTMEKEEVTELVEQIRNMHKYTFSEFSHKALWEGATSFELIQMYDEIGPELTKEYATHSISTFRKQYEEGLELGDWSIAADKLYEATSHLDGIKVDLSEWSDRVLSKVESDESEPVR